MIKAIRIHSPGGPEVMKWEDVPRPEPGPGEALIKQEAVGLNYIDVYFRSGLYKAPTMPLIIGQEGAGTVIAVGQGVTTVKPGDRVAYAGALGGYATERVIAADRLVKLPDAIDFKTAAAMMLQGMTAQYLIRRTYRGEVRRDHRRACRGRRRGADPVPMGEVPRRHRDRRRFHRAEGGTRPRTWCGAYGGRATDLVAEVKRITGGAMVPVVYDSVGKDTWNASLDCLAPLGLMVSYGNASGPVPPVDIGILSAKGSLYVTRPSLATYTAKRADLEKVAADLFDVVSKGVVKIEVNQTFPLKDAAAAHIALESRKTTGSTVLLP